MSEEWRPVVGWEGLYEVSSLGRIQSLDRIEVIVDKNGRVFRRSRRGRVLCTYAELASYPTVQLKDGDRSERRNVHRYVCEAFHGLPEPGHEVSHRDGDRSNARADNLEWATHAHNMRQRIVHETNNPGERCHLAKLNDSAVREIRLKTDTAGELARRFGVTPQTIWNIQKRKTWRHIA